MKSINHIDEFLESVRDHIPSAIKIHPEFKGINCVTNEFADLVKAVENEDDNEIKRQCIHLAVTAFRLYEESCNN